MQGMLKNRVGLFLISIISIVLFLSCDSQERYYDIVAIDFPSYDSVRALLGDSEDIKLLLPPGSESHHYEPTPKDMIALSEAKLVVYTGGESERWVDSILSTLDTPVASFRLIDQVEVVEEENKAGMAVKNSHDHGDIDEHVWTSPINEIAIIDNIADVLISIYPERKDDLNENRNDYIAKLKELDSEIRDIVASSKYDTLIFGSRFPFRYFVEEYGLDYYAAFPGCAEESEPSAKTIAFLIDKIKEMGVGYVLDIEFGSPLIVSAIAEEAGVESLVFNSMHNISTRDFIAGENYISIMKKNIEVLKEVLN